MVVTVEYDFVRAVSLSIVGKEGGQRGLVVGAERAPLQPHLWKTLVNLSRVNDGRSEVNGE